MKRLTVCVLLWATCCLAVDLTTLDGKTYQNFRVTRVDSDGIYVLHSTGGGKLLFTQLPEDIRKQYNYTPPPTQGPGNAITQPATAIPPPASQIPPPSTNAQPSPPANTDPNCAAQDTLKLRKIAAQQMIAEGEQILVAAGMAHNYRGISRGTRVTSFANSVQRRGQSLIDKGKAMLAQAEDELAVLNGEPPPVRTDAKTGSKRKRQVASSRHSATKTKTVSEPNSATPSTATSAIAQNTASFQPFSAPLLDTIKQLMAPEHRSYSFHKIDNKWFGTGGTVPVYLIGQNHTLEALEIPASLEYLLQKGSEAGLSTPEGLMLPLFRNSWKRARALIEFATDRQTSEKVEIACKSMVESWNSAGRPFKKDVADDRYSIEIEKGASDITHPVNIRIKARRPQPTATTNTPAFNGKAVQVEISSKAKTWLTSLGTEMDSLMFGAMRNDPISQTLIGATLLSSKDAELCKEAIRLLQAAADQGNATAQYKLAGIYREGITRNSEQLIATNVRLARTMYEKAAKQGHWDSLALLNDPEFWKKHGFNDLIESYKWCLLAEQQEEVPSGESRLGDLEQQMTSVQIGEAKRLAKEFKGPQSTTLQGKQPQEDEERTPASVASSRNTAANNTNDSELWPLPRMIAEAGLKLLRYTREDPGSYADIWKCSEMSSIALVKYNSDDNVVSVKVGCGNRVLSDGTKSVEERFATIRKQVDLVIDTLHVLTGAPSARVWFATTVGNDLVSALRALRSGKRGYARSDRYQMRHHLINYSFSDFSVEVELHIKE